MHAIDVKLRHLDIVVLMLITCIFICEMSYVTVGIFFIEMIYLIEIIYFIFVYLKFLKY